MQWLPIATLRRIFDQAVLFLPFMMDSQKRGLPVVTVFICLLCLFVYWEQYTTDKQHSDAVAAFCSETLDTNTLTIHRRIGERFPGIGCQLIYKTLRDTESPAERLREIIDSIEPLGLFTPINEDRAYMYGLVAERFKRYQLQVPAPLTAKLAYDPANPDIRRMLTSTFSHGDVIHLLGNLLFFFIFAASVELVVGNLLFAGFIAFATVGTSLGYSYATLGVAQALPTVGLSGVVMAALAALGVIVPRAQIRCFFWFLLMFRVFRLPVWLLALWYIGWDLFELNRLGATTYVNYASHISGAVLGVLFGLICLVFARESITAATEEYISSEDLPLTTLRIR